MKRLTVQESQVVRFGRHLIGSRTISGSLLFSTLGISHLSELSSRSKKTWKVLASSISPTSPASSQTTPSTWKLEISTESTTDWTLPGLINPSRSQTASMRSRRIALRSSSSNKKSSPNGRTYLSLRSSKSTDPTKLMIKCRGRTQMAASWKWWKKCTSTVTRKWKRP